MNEPQEQQVDEFHGMGGSYVVVDGKRQLVERTQDTASEEAEVVPPSDSGDASGKSASKRNRG